MRSVVRESSVPEFGRLLLAAPWLGLTTPLGYGRPVLLIPGFGTTDASLELMARWLRSRGYRTYRSRVGVNVGGGQWHCRRLERRLAHIAAAQGERVAIVGHSRGGILAKTLATARPDLVAGIVTLGSPTRSRWVGGPGGRFPRSVGYVSIFSRTDRVARWRQCAHPAARNIAVGATHVGLAHNAEVYRALGEALPTFWRGSDTVLVRARKQVLAWARVATPV